MHSNSQAALRGAGRRRNCSKELHRALRCLKPEQSDGGQVCLGGRWVVEGQGCIETRLAKWAEDGPDRPCVPLQGVDLSHKGWVSI